MGRLKLATIALVAYQAFGALPASAAVTSMTVDYEAPFGTYGGRTYVYKEVTLNGTVQRAAPATDGTYSVGMVLIYPKSGANGVALVDWINTVFFYRYNSICPSGEPFCDPLSGAHSDRRLEGMMIPFSLYAMEDYLWEEGYTFATVMWDKTVVDHFGPTVPTDDRHNRLVYGRIDNPRDAMTILSDAARFLRNPTAYPDADRPAATNTIFSFGYSQTGAIQESYIAYGFNVEPTTQTAIYDGHLIAMRGIGCWQFETTFQRPLWLTYGEISRCTSPLTNAPGNAKVMLVNSQSDMEVNVAVLARNTVNDPNYVSYEVAGMAHLPLQIMDVSAWGGTKQSPVDGRPFFRGALQNLTAWAKNGTAPPPPVFIEGTFDTTVTPPKWTTALDADGNAVGGTRLPQMPSIIDGMPAGAPTGKYTGIEPAGLTTPRNVFLLLGGTYKRWDDARLSALYPTPAVYKERIKRSADALLAGKYITAKDHAAYIAGSPDLPDLPPLPPLPEPEPYDGGCSSSGTSSGIALGLLVLVGLALFRRPRRR